MFFFKGWLKARQRPEEFENLSCEDLNNLLEVFYMEAKTIKGDSYSKSSMTALRCGINRYLNLPPYKRNINIICSAPFASSKRMWDAVVKKNKQDGKCKAKSWPAIEKLDFAKLKQDSSFNMSDPNQLQEKVFFDIQLFFGRRGREGLRSLKKSSFDIKKDDSGVEYCEIAFNESTKNHQTSEAPGSKGAMYATGGPQCPIKSLKLYLSKLCRDSEDFFVKVRTDKNFRPDLEETWFTGKPLGVNSIGDFMKKISERLHLSKKYTNHSVRATTVTTLSDNGIEARQIMNVTGHKCESSLRSYNTDNSNAQKRKISSILASETSIQTIPAETENEIQEVQATCSNEGSHLQHAQKILKVFDNSSSTSNNISTTNGAPYFLNPTFNNCTFNFK